MTVHTFRAAVVIGAPPRPKVRQFRWWRVARRLRRLGLGVVGVTAAACSDAPTGPLLRASIEEPLPAVTDARDRLAPALENAGVRTRIVHDLQQVATALSAGDAQRARYHTRLAANILLDYRVGLGSVAKDGPDVTAIALALHAVAKVVGSDFDVSVFR